ncbi:MAG TPA: homocysteine S-methyltransferase family protein [Planctomycetota bacterium]|nr:homocysteine S-methyltransferase family protein [Planctomycetota bacterium]
MIDLKKLLKDRRVLVSDGAWGTELAKRGLGAGEVPERWNVERPDEVRGVAASYVAAGSDIILTNSFGGTSIKLARSGLAGRAGEFNLAAAELSKKAAAGKALVFASVGSCGEILEPYGELTPEKAQASFAEQVRWLAEGGADGIVIETLADLGEARIALSAAKESCRLPVVVSMTFEKGPGGIATMMGVRPEQAAAELTAAGADMVGANCGAGIEQMIEVTRALRAATKLPLWIKPNAGKPELVGGRTVYRETPAEFAARAAELVAAGAAVVGGCCGTTPEHIRLMVEAVARLRAAKR